MDVSGILQKPGFDSFAQIFSMVLDADVNGALNFGIEAIFFNPNQVEITQSINQITNLAQLKKLF